MIDLILHVLCLGAVILFLARTLPGIYIDSYGTAVLVAIVYGLINVTLGFILKLLGALCSTKMKFYSRPAHIFSSFFQGNRTSIK